MLIRSHTHLQPVGEDDVGVHGPHVQMVDHGVLQPVGTLLQRQQLPNDVITHLIKVGHLGDKNEKKYIKIMTPPQNLRLHVLVWAYSANPLFWTHDLRTHLNSWVKKLPNILSWKSTALNGTLSFAPKLSRIEIHRQSSWGSHDLLQGIT